jgi:lipoyl(octanoyl) transferase
MQVIDLGQMPYRDAWAEQERAHEAVLGGAEERIFVVEHPPVITLGRRAGAERNLVASADELQRRGVELVQSDRGGDVTFHGPGQIVAYPIVRLLDHRLSVGSYVRALEHALIATLADFGIVAGKDACAIGVWVRPDAQQPAGKIAALGVRVRRGVTLHGIALNVTTNLDYFKLIVPCGLAGRPVASMRQLLGDRTPPIERVRAVLCRRIEQSITGDTSGFPEIQIIGEGARKCETAVGGDQ